jgi:hypothetical protein
MTSPDWLRLFPDADHRMQMNLRRGDAAQFWQRSPQAESILAERRRWLAQTPQRYLQILPEGEEAVSEAITCIRSLQHLPPCPPLQAAGDIEPDWIVLSGDAARSHPVIGGAVVFPSSWALEDKIGRPLHDVHAPVPGLQSSMGSQISTFLTRLVPHVAWERENWGLSADPALNHHPANPVRRLDARATLDQTWLRLEQQFLTRLPDTNAILFGICVTNHRLDHLAGSPEVAQRLARILATISDEFAGYKGLQTARAPLVAALTRAGAPGT